MIKLKCLIPAVLLLAALPCLAADLIAPTAPGAPSISNRTSSGFTVSWAAATDNLSVQRYEVMLGSQVHEPAANVRSMVFTGLKLNTSYSVSVYALDAAGNRSPRSELVRVSTDVLAPTAPGKPKISSRSSTGFSVSWAQSTDNVAVKVYRLSLNGKDYSVSPGSAASVSKVFSGLKTNTAYTLSVSAYDAAGNRSPVSAETLTSTDIKAPAVPRMVTIGNRTSTGFTVSWLASTDNVAVSSYRVSLNGSEHVVAAPAVSKTFTGLVAGSSHSVHVRALDESGNRSAPSSTLSVDLTSAAAGGGEISRISTAADGQQFSGDSYNVDYNSVSHTSSADGRYVAFLSETDNLSQPSPALGSQIAVKDRVTGAVTIVSQGADGRVGNWSSGSASFSANGRYVAFHSGADNLTPVITTRGLNQIYVKDLQTGVVQFVSLGLEGIPGNGNSYFPRLSADGKHVAFLSTARNLVEGDTNNSRDVFVKNLETGVIVRASTDAQGGQVDTQTEKEGSPIFSVFDNYVSLSADGQMVAFTSDGSDLVPGDSNNVNDVFVKNLQTGAIVRVSTSADGSEGSGKSWGPSLSADGTLVAFTSESRSLVPGGRTSSLGSDVLVKTLATGAITRVSSLAESAMSSGISYAKASFSADARYLTFEASAGGDQPYSQVHIVDRVANVAALVSINSAGVAGNEASASAAISDDGRFVSFHSYASNLVAGDSNSSSDVFVALNPLDMLAPAAPGTPKISGRSSSGFTVSWAAAIDNVGVDHYELWVNSSRYTVQDTRLVLTGLAANTAYTVSVEAIDALGNRSPRSALTTTSTDLSLPVQSGVPLASDVSATGFTLTWPASTDNGSIARYEVRLNGVVYPVAANQLRKVFTGLAPSTLYTAVLYAFDASGNSSERSPDVTVTTLADTTAPRQPGAITVTRRSTNSISVKWGASSDNVRTDYYLVQFNGATVWTTGTSYTFGSLTPFTAYKVKVTAHDAAANASAAQTATVMTAVDGIVRVSTTDSGAEQGAGGLSPYVNSYSISADGRYVAFASGADNLVVGDGNARHDIFVKDLQTGVVVRASTSNTGVEGNGNSQAPSLSADGRYVVFSSDASNLSPLDHNGTTTDVFIKDLYTGGLDLISRAVEGVPSSANGASRNPVISANGLHIAFESVASNLVLNDSNGKPDIFVKRLDTGSMTLESTAANGMLANGESYMPSLSGDGKQVAFYSWSSNLLAGDVNGHADIFVKNLRTGAIQLVSSTAGGAWSSGGPSFNPRFSADGTHVAFDSFAHNLIAGDTSVRHVYVKNLASGSIVRASLTADGVAGNSYSSNPSLNADGTLVSFSSGASNLVAGDSNAHNDVFVKNLQTSAIVRLSRTAAGEQANNYSTGGGMLSDDGRLLVFSSPADNLVVNDFNMASDAFVADNPLAP